MDPQHELPPRPQYPRLPPGHPFHKKNILIAIVILVLILLGIMAYRYRNQQTILLTGPAEQAIPDSPQVVLPSQNPENESEWNVYASEENFSFRYPPDWILAAECKFGDICITSRWMETETVTQGQDAETVRVQLGAVIGIRTFDQEEPLTKEAFCDPEGTKIRTCEETTWKGRQAFIRTEGDPEDRTVLMVQVNGKVFAVMAAYATNDAEMKKLAGKTLLTFEFGQITMPALPADWETHTNTEMGISFEYPGTWNIISLKDTWNFNGAAYHELLGVVPDGEEKSSNPAIQLSYYENPQGLSVPDYNAKYLTKTVAGDPVLIWSPDYDERISVSGIKAYYSSEYYCIATCEVYVWRRKDKIWKLKNFPSGIPAQKEIFEKIFNSIGHS